MQDFQGTLIRAGEVVLDPVSGGIEVATNPTGFRCWSGYLCVPQGCHVAIRVQYLLQLRDGRSGLILTRGLSVARRGRTFIQFVGSTTLQ
jgi:hypothetical protein